MKIQYLLIVLLFISSACGFQLRGTQQKTTLKASEIYVIEVGANRVADEVRQRLQSAGVDAVQSRDEAKYVIRLEREAFDQNVLSVSAQTGKVEEYQVSLSVYLVLLDASGKQLIDAKEISLTKDYTFDEDAVLGKFEEEEELRNELVSEAAEEIIRRLDAVLSDD